MKTPVAVIKTGCLGYREEFLFDKNNAVYQGVEDIFYRLGMDVKNYGLPTWNPLGSLVKRGQNIVIKPNFVTTRDREKILEGNELSCSSTHPAVIRPIIDYSWKALEGKGKISVVDSPIEGSNFKKTASDLGMYKLLEFYKNRVNVELIDLRDFDFKRKMLFDNLIIGNRSINIGLLMKREIEGDPLGYRLVDLGDKSNFANFNNYQGLRFHKSNKKAPIPYHSSNKNIYSISNTVLDADLFINVPKLKTHKKTGVTISLKSLIGTSNRKHWLPHYQAGSPPLGDEYPEEASLRERMISQLSRFPLPKGHSFIFNIPNVLERKNLITEGCWSGNKTLWRTILDFNSILFYADKRGVLSKRKQRNYITIVDGIIGGEGEGPLRSSPKKCGVLIGGYDPVAVDAVATSAMGLNASKINHIEMAEQNAFYIGTSKPEQIKIVPEKHASLNFNFKVPQSWKDIKLRC